MDGWMDGWLVPPPQTYRMTASRRNSTFVMSPVLSSHPLLVISLPFSPSHKIVLDASRSYLHQPPQQEEKWWRRPPPQVKTYTHTHTHAHWLSEQRDIPREVILSSMFKQIITITFGTFDYPLNKQKLFEKFWKNMVLFHRLPRKQSSLYIYILMGIDSQHVSTQNSNQLVLYS